MLRSSRRIIPSSEGSLSILDNIKESISLAKQLKPLNIFITDNFDRAVEQAEALTGADCDEKGSLNGIPLAIKDCFSTSGVRTTCGSRMLENYIPPYTATAVQKLIDEGCISLGKTNMDEFSMGTSGTQGYFGPVKNPWTTIAWQLKYPKMNTTDLRKKLDTDWHIAGGSSAGSAVSVACGVADVALGSDCGGSIRNPAAHCGVVGVKPTYGLISRHGLIPLVNSLDVVGYFTRSVDLAIHLLEVLRGIDIRDATTRQQASSKPHNDIPRLPVSTDLDPSGLIRGLRIGIPEEYNIADLDPEHRKAWNWIANELDDNGASVETCNLPHTAYSIVTYHVLAECEIASNMARYDGVQFGHKTQEAFNNYEEMYALTRHEAFNEVVRRRILAGNFFLLKRNYDQYFLKAQKVRRAIANDFSKVFQSDEFDVLLTPVTLTDAPLYTDFTSSDSGYDRERQDDYFTQPANMAGIPALSVPVKISSRGLPISLQLMADSFNEDKLFRVARWIENLVEFPGLDISQVLRIFETRS